MVKKHLFCVSILTQTNILFAVKELHIGIQTSNESIARMSFNSAIPGEILLNNSLKTYQERKKNIKYHYLNQIIEYTSLANTPDYQVRVHEFKSNAIFNSLKHTNTSKLSPKSIIRAASDTVNELKSSLTLRNKYIVLDFTSATPYAYKHLSFVWQHKSYDKLNQYEKKIADLYKANAQSKIKFLYAWDRPNSEPWAIAINKEPHSIIWVNADIKDIPDESQADPFLIIDPKDQNKSLTLLIDENGIPIAKKINGVIIYRK